MSLRIATRALATTYDRSRGEQTRGKGDRVCEVVVAAVERGGSVGAAGR